MEGKEEDQNSVTNQIVEDAKNAMLPETARALAISIVKGGVMIVLFLASRIALLFVTALADAISKLPIVSQLNKTTGMLYGLLRGILIIYVGLLLVAIPRKN